VPRNVALVGCGAIAQRFYLSELAKRRRHFDRFWVVDPSANVLATARAIINDAEQAARLSEVMDDLQFVIVASSTSSHFLIAREALSRGAHVLVEKPFVIWPDEGRELIQLAEVHDRVLAINQTRRVFPHAVDLRRRIVAGEFGALNSIVHHEGAKITWPFSSGASFARDARRSGVIMDIGVHVLDFYQYLLEPTWSYDSAIHDGFNGPEGLAELNLKANDSPVYIKLSRYQKQGNVALLRFEKAEVRLDIHRANVYSVVIRSSGKIIRISLQPKSVDFSFLADKVLNNFFAAANDGEVAICDGKSSLPVIEILDEIYQRARRYPEALGTV
jgi:predicted dehydrogenase